MIRIFFAPPRVGKTTFAVKMINQQVKSRRCFSNFSQSVPGASVADLTGLGEWTFPLGSYISVDEAGIDFNNRLFKTFPKSLIGWLKLHGHERHDLDFFSQSFDDTDLTIRRLAVEYWLLRKIGPWTVARCLISYTDVNDEKQVVTMYEKSGFLSLVFHILFWPFIRNKKWMVCFRPFYYRYFDSWSRDQSIPVRDFPVNPKLRK